jgi:AcrR family transcriptional regulator
MFAERGITAVSIRTIADAAGISHGLVQQYFGTRENMVAEIIKHEIDVVMAAPPHGSVRDGRC